MAGVSEVLQSAWNRTVKVCITDFKATKWLGMAFVAWVVSFGEGGWGLRGRTSTRSGGGGEGFEGFGRFVVWLKEHGDQVALLIAAALMVLLAAGALGLLVSWLKARMEFVFVHCIAQDRVAIGEGWEGYQAQGRSLFIARALIGAALALPTLGILAWAGWVLLDSLIRGDASSLLVLLGPALAIIPLSLLYLVIDTTIRDLIVPVMYGRQCDFREAWRIVRAKMLGVEPSRVALVLLLRWLASGAMTLTTSALGCLVCCMSWVPFLWVVVLLPGLVFQRALGLYLAEQLVEDVAIFHDEPAP